MPSASKTALLVVPDYDGTFVSQTPGTELVTQDIKASLENHGNYNVQVLSGAVSIAELNQQVAHLTSCEGSILFYFYGHAIQRGKASRNFFVTSDGVEFNEGIAVSGLISDLVSARANEVLIFADCCHSGASCCFAPQDFPTLSVEQNGRAIFAASAENQVAWARGYHSNSPGGVFSGVVLEGLNGAAARNGNVKATSLSDYILDTFSEWGQAPHVILKANGDRQCLITSGFDDRAANESVPEGRNFATVLGLPFRPSANFVGRESELTRLIELLTDGARPVSVSATVEGIGGIGKTELVVQLLCTDRINSYFDLIVWLDASGPLVPQMIQFSDRLGQKIAGLDEFEAANKFDQILLSYGRVLIVLDNAEEWNELAPLIPKRPALLVTTRSQRFGGARFRHIELDELSLEAARELFVELAPKIKDDPGLEALLLALSGHALAIELVAGTIENLDLSIADYTQKWTTTQDPPEAVLKQVRYGKSVNDSIRATWDSLSSDVSRKLWLRASLFAPLNASKDLLRCSFVADDTATEEFYDITGQYRISRSSMLATFKPYVSSDEFDTAFAELRARNVFARATDDDTAEWSMHRLVRDFARSKLPKLEFVAHSLALSNWTRDAPASQLNEASPHLISAVLDEGTFGGGVLYRGRHLSREVGFRSGILMSRGVARFLRAEMRNPKALTLLFDGLSDQNTDVRRQALVMLNELTNIPEVLEGVANALSDPDPEIRDIASKTILNSGQPKTVETLVSVARKKERARDEAIRILDGLDSDEAQAALLSLSEDPKFSKSKELALSLSARGVSRNLDVVKGIALEGRQSLSELRALTGLWLCEPDFVVSEYYPKNVLEAPVRAAMTFVALQAAVKTMPKKKRRELKVDLEPLFYDFFSNLKTAVEWQPKEITDLQEKVRRPYAISWSSFSSLNIESEHIKKLEFVVDLAGMLDAYMDERAMAYVSEHPALALAILPKLSAAKRKEHQNLIDAIPFQDRFSGSLELDLELFNFQKKQKRKKALELTAQNIRRGLDEKMIAMLANEIAAHVRLKDFEDLVPERPAPIEKLIHELKSKDVK